MQQSFRRIQEKMRGVLQKDEGWYRAQLMAKTYPVLTRGRDFVIRCPFHNDSDPSCGVDRLTGRFNCWSCPEGRGGWNKLAEKLGMEKITGRDLDEKQETRAMARVSRALHKASGSKTPLGVTVTVESRPLIRDWPRDRRWRGLSGKWLDNLGCKLIMDLAHGVERIGLPVRTVDGSLAEYSCRALSKPAEGEKEGPKYVPLSPGFEIKKTHAKRALFLIDKVVESDSKTVVLVEGPFDALNLYYRGIPAVSIMGVENWNEAKAATISGLGVDKVIVLMDNDRAGRQARKKIVGNLRGSGFDVVPIKLPEDTHDPGEMDDAQIRWLAKKIR